MTKNENNLIITPLGGIEEIGKNITLYKYNENGFIIDCGLKFASKLKEPGFNNVFTDYKYIKKQKSYIKAIIITHAHLDHIGGIPYLLQYINVPIYCSRFAKKMIELIIQNNYPSLKPPKFKIIIPNVNYKIETFNIEFIPIEHSIIDSYALSIRTPIGNIFHSGDYRIDVQKYKSIFKKIKSNIKQYGKYLALFSDSTNSITQKQTITEKKVIEEIKNIILKTKGRIIIASFSTQVLRIKMLIEICEKLNKKIFFAGKSLQNIVEISLELNLFKKNSSFVSYNEIKSVNPNNLVVFTTGTQGESLSGLQLMSMNKHRVIKLKKTDTIIMSSSVIPGNELSVNEMFNNLIKKELKIITHKDRPIHMSGHGSKEEIKIMINNIKPKYFIPIHGEPIHLNEAKKAAIEEGILEQNIFIINNGTSLFFKENEFIQKTNNNIENMYKDGILLNKQQQNIIEERTKLSSNGCIFFTLLKENSTLKHSLKTKGFINTNENKEIMKNFNKEIDIYFNQNFLNTDISEKNIVTIKNKINDYFFVKTGKKPILVFNLIQNNKIY